MRLVLVAGLIAVVLGGQASSVGAHETGPEVGLTSVVPRAVGLKLTGRGERAAGAFGYSIALSGDGDTALVGAPGDGVAHVGVTRVFIRVGDTWRQQGPGLMGSGEMGPYASRPGVDENLGLAVALSANGDTALVSAPNDDRFRGAVWVFTRRHGVWSQDGPKLVAKGEVGEANFGWSVAISGDGKTALIGAPDDRTLPISPGSAGFGAAWVFVRTGSGWRQLGAKLTGRNEPAYGDFGLAVALSADGNTGIVGSYSPRSRRGAAWIFTRTGRIWQQQGTTLEPNDEVGAGYFGGSVALSANGDTALIGGLNDSNSAGAAWVFARTDGRWAQRAPKLIVNDESDKGGFGSSVALSTNGGTALIGGWPDSKHDGAAWIFARVGTTWTQQGPKLIGKNEIGHAGFGTEVALSSSGATGLVSGNGDNHNLGAVWVLPISPRAPFRA